MLGFGVSFIIGLAPYLGRIRIPGFTPLLSLIPQSIQDTAIPISAAVMGLVAVAIQWGGFDNLTQAWLTKWFKRTALLFLIGAITITVLHTFVVVRVQFLGGKDSESFMVGFSRPIRPPCTEDISDAECIKYLTFDQSKIESFWGDKQVRSAKLLLVLTYVALTSSFGLLVGLLLLRQLSLPASKRLHDSG
jgi:hypothetical protein